MIAGGCDRACRAEIEAAGAADDTRSRMRANLCVELDIARLVESAGKVPSFQNNPQDGCWIARIGAQIAVAQIERRKQGASPERSMIRSQRETAPLRGDKNFIVPRDDGAVCREIVHR